MIKVGAFELHAASDGFFKLDGGAMFGIVPKVVWEKVTSVDDRNRIPMALTALLIRGAGKNILVDTGIGGAAKRGAKFNDMYGVTHPPALLDSLAAIGISPVDIDYVVLSHLHFDHAGGATRLQDGTCVPTFPRAAYLVQEGMWREAQEPNPRTKGSYFPDDFLPLEKAGRLRLIHGDFEIVPGVHGVLTGGHVKHHQVVMIESEGDKAIYWADMMPTSHHVKPAWVMGYDLFPADVAALKQQWLAQAVRERWVNVFEHDPNIAMGRIVDDGKGGYKVEVLEKVAA
ncbi:MAG: MBL fold metallo-hydrolase [Planctomycetes bacterium]|nr:MBL fold metallo-hydrolase [Planctomycetota bacterium]